MGAPGARPPTSPGRAVRRRRHRHGERQVAGLPAARAVVAARRRPGDRALPVADQGARHRPAARRAGAEPHGRRAPRPTTATPPARSATGCAGTGGWCSPTPTWSAAGVLPRHATSPPSCAGCATSSSTSATPTAGSSARHVAQVLRRLRRVCARYGASPGVPARLGDLRRPGGLGVPAGRAAGRGGRPRTPRRAGRPSSRSGSRRWCPTSAARTARPCAARPPPRPGDLLADLVVEGARTIAFVRSRRGAESVALTARRGLAEVSEASSAGSPPTGRATCRRSGASSSGGCRAATCSASPPPTPSSSASTSPGSTPSCSPAGPARSRRSGSRPGAPGRAGQGALAVFVARDDPLDTYLVHHPQALFGRPVEATVLDPSNPYVLAPHLCCAAAELPLTDDDLPLFGDARRRSACCWATSSGAGCCSTGPAAGSGPRATVPRPTCAAAAGRRCGSSRRAPGRLLGTVDHAASHSQAHTGAVYLHQGETLRRRAARPRGVGRARPPRRPRPHDVGPRRHRHPRRRGAARPGLRRRPAVVRAPST